MKTLLKRPAGALLAVVLVACVSMSGCNNNQHSVSDWRLLFDGKTLGGWMGANGKKIGEAWQVIDNELVLTTGGGGDIVTVDKFENFELELEWKISEKGNSGIMYRVADGDKPVWMSGMEYQVLDNNYPGLEKDSHTAGALYDLYAPVNDVTKPVGEFNHTRIRVKDGHVQHWLNGKQVVDYKLWSKDWLRRFENSKFSTYTEFARVQRGRIALQDHGDKVWYRNIKIKEL